MTDDIKEMLELHIKNDIDLLPKNQQKVLDYITNLQTIADNRMGTILKIEKYCIEEKEDLISCGEVCEDVLKIVDELKGK